MTPSTFRDQVARLVALGILDTKSDNRKTIFTVVKWAQYQIDQPRHDSTSDSNPTTGRQLADTDKNVRMEEQDRLFDQATAFASLWKSYPRREGRKDAEKHFRASVKSPADLARIIKALANYKAKLVRDRTEPRYIQQGKTWFNNWDDWEDAEPVKLHVPSAMMLSEMERRNAANS